MQKESNFFIFKKVAFIFFSCYKKDKQYGRRNIMIKTVFLTDFEINPGTDKDITADL